PSSTTNTKSSRVARSARSLRPPTRSPTSRRAGCRGSSWLSASTTPCRSRFVGSRPSAYAVNRRLPMSEHPSDEPRRSTQPPRVLVVDDEPQVLVALEDLLSEEFDVRGTDQPEQALRIAEEDPDIAVVVSDQRMPRMTGDELLSRLRRCSNAMRI